MVRDNKVIKSCYEIDAESYEEKRIKHYFDRMPNSIAEASDVKHRKLEVAIKSMMNVETGKVESSTVLKAGLRDQGLENKKVKKDHDVTLGRSAELGSCLFDKNLYKNARS